MASFQSILFRGYLRYQSRDAHYQVPLPALRRRLDAYGRRVPLPADIGVTRLTVAGQPAEWIRAPKVQADAALLYLHGGAYTMGSCDTHRGLAARLSAATGLPVLLPEYRLAPEHPFPAALDDATAAYHWLLAQGLAPERLILAGDSAGGGLTAATLTQLRATSTPLPQAAVLLSPWTDLEATGESVVTKANDDPWLSPHHLAPMAAHYLNGHDPRHPHISPIHADLTGLPPMLIHVGTDEILLHDATRLADRAQQHGVDVTLDVWEGMFHVWHLFAYLIPEGKQAIDQIGTFVRRQLAI